MTETSQRRRVQLSEETRFQFLFESIQRQSVVATRAKNSSVQRAHEKQNSSVGLTPSTNLIASYKRLNRGPGERR